MTWPMMALGWMVNMVQRGSASMKRIEAILAVEPEIRDKDGAVPFDGPGRIEFRRLTFRYDENETEKGPPALQDITLTIEPGQTLGVVGLTGAGKSTLAHLIVRAFDPPPGTLLIDGRDPKASTRSWASAGWRSRAVSGSASRSRAPCSWTLRF